MAHYELLSLAPRSEQHSTPPCLSEFEINYMKSYMKMLILVVLSCRIDVVELHLVMIVGFLISGTFGEDIWLSEVIF